MTQNGYKPANFRIYSHTTKNRILHIEDALDLGRLRFELWEYTKGQGSRTHVECWLPHPEARLLFSDAITCDLPVDQKGVYHTWMSGTPKGGKPQAAC